MNNSIIFLWYKALSTAATLLNAKSLRSIFGDVKSCDDDDMDYERYLSIYDHDFWDHGLYPVP